MQEKWSTRIAAFVVYICLDAHVRSVLPLRICDNETLLFYCSERCWLVNELGKSRTDMLGWHVRMSVVAIIECVVMSNSVLD